MFNSLEWTAIGLLNAVIIYQSVEYVVNYRKPPTRHSVLGSNWSFSYETGYAGTTCLGDSTGWKLSRSKFMLWTENACEIYQPDHLLSTTDLVLRTPCVHIYWSPDRHGCLRIKHTWYTKIPVQWNRACRLFCHSNKHLHKINANVTPCTSHICGRNWHRNK